MSHQIKASRILKSFGFLAIMSFAVTSFGAGFGNSTAGKDMFIANYESLKAKIISQASVAEKMNFIKTQDQSFIQMFQLMKNEVIKNRKLADHPDYAYVVELYDQYVPLLNLKMDADGKRVSQVSCLESQSLVFTKDRELPIEDGEDIRLSPESLGTAELLKKLCN